MKAAKILLSGCCLVAISGCTSTVTTPLAVLTPAEQARACVESKDISAVPEIMTYNRGVETHFSHEGTKQSFSVQDKSKSTAYAIKGDTAKGNIIMGPTPSVCHEDGVDQGVAAGIIAGAVAATVK